ncbi:hypothetical protein ACFLWW_00830 [Chloroflexota bacterium]
MYQTIFFEDLGKPGVAICNEGFIGDGRAASFSKGIPGFRLVAETVPSECNVIEQVEEGISEAVVDEVVAALTKPPTADEKSPESKERELPRVVFKGNLQEINSFFYKRGWTDGLPIIPPTQEAVDEMLTGTDLPPDHVVAKMIPRLGKATVEKIAINAVMAGAIPPYMPLLIAGVQALVDPASSLYVFGVSTSSWSPLWVINGPIRNDLNINSGLGALSPGNIANATIGRAMGLIIRNIAGIRRGIEDMGCLGNAGKYSMVLAENEEKSPWEPLHVERGLNKEDSAITVFYANCYVQSWPHGTNAKGVLESAIANTAVGLPGRNAAFLLPPTNAKWLADEGWTKAEIREFLKEYARVPAYQHSYKAFWGNPPREFSPVSEMSSMRLFLHSDNIIVVVAGDVHNVQGLVLGSKSSGESIFVTRKAELPANWDNLVKKYKDMVPTYIRYY